LLHLHDPVEPSQVKLVEVQPQDDDDTLFFRNSAELLQLTQVYVTKPVTMNALEFPQSHTPLLKVSAELTQLQVFELGDVLPFELIVELQVTQVVFDPLPI
jgi:hypothetical protein